MVSEDRPINSSSLTKFRRQRLKDMNLLDLLIEKTVESAIEKEIIQSLVLIVDATYTKVRYNQKTPQEILRNQSKQVRKVIYSIDDTMKEKFPKKPVEDTIEAAYTEDLVKIIEDKPKLVTYPKVKEPLNLLKETLDDDRHFIRESEDSDARVGHKSKNSSFFGYKTHLAMSDERIITGATITTGEKNDGKELKTLIEKSQKAGMVVESVVGDAAYSEKKYLLHKSTWYKARRKTQTGCTRDEKKRR